MKQSLLLLLLSSMDLKEVREALLMMASAEEALSLWGPRGGGQEMASSSSPSIQRAALERGSIVVWKRFVLLSAKEQQKRVAECRDVGEKGNSLFTNLRERRERKKEGFHLCFVV